MSYMSDTSGSTATARVPSPPTFLSALEVAVDNAMNVAARLEGLAGALCGSYIDKGGNPALGVVQSDGLFGTLNDRASALNLASGRANAALDRITAALP